MSVYLSGRFSQQHVASSSSLLPPPPSLKPLPRGEAAIRLGRLSFYSELVVPETGSLIRILGEHHQTNDCGCSCSLLERRASSDAFPDRRTNPLETKESLQEPPSVDVVEWAKTLIRPADTALLELDPLLLGVGGSPTGGAILDFAQRVLGRFTENVSGSASVSLVGSGTSIDPAFIFPVETYCVDIRTEHVNSLLPQEWAPLLKRRTAAAVVGRVYGALQAVLLLNETLHSTTAATTITTDDNAFGGDVLQGHFVTPPAATLEEEARQGAIRMTERAKDALVASQQLVGSPPGTTATLQLSPLFGRPFRVTRAVLPPLSAPDEKARLSDAVRDALDISVEPQLTASIAPTHQRWQSHGKLTGVDQRRRSTVTPDALFLYECAATLMCVMDAYTMDLIQHWILAIRNSKRMTAPSLYPPTLWIFVGHKHAARLHSIAKRRLGLVESRPPSTNLEMQCLSTIYSWYLPSR